MRFQRVSLVVTIAAALATAACPNAQRSEPTDAGRDESAALHLLPDRAQARTSVSRGPGGGFRFRRGELQSRNEIVGRDAAAGISEHARTLGALARASTSVPPGDAAVGLLALAATGVSDVSDEFGVAIDRLEEARDAALDDAARSRPELPLVLTSLLDDYGLTGRVMTKLSAVRCAELMCEPQWFESVQRTVSALGLARIEAWTALSVVEWRLSGIAANVSDPVDERLELLVHRMRTSRLPAGSGVEAMLRVTTSALVVPPGSLESPRFDLTLEHATPGEPPAMEDEFLIRTGAHWIGVEIGRSDHEASSPGRRLPPAPSVRDAGLALLILAAPMRLSVP